MSDERDEDEPDRRRTDEPLGDVAAEVRERADDLNADDHPTREGPLADVASEVDERRRRADDTFDAFESVDVGDIDGEQLWEQLAADDDGDVGVAVPARATEPSVETDSGPDASNRDVRTIPKETCHGCPHLADPPELACTHEGTTILAMPDSDHFRVADCPMVVGEADIAGLGVPSEASGEAETGDSEARAAKSEAATDESDTSADDGG